MKETIVPGMMIYVKTTGEQGMVLAVSEKMPENEAFALYDPKFFTGKVATIKIPKATRQSGIVQAVEFFTFEELETAKEKMSREYDEMFELGSEVRVDKAKKQLTKDEDLPN